MPHPDSNLYSTYMMNQVIARAHQAGQIALRYFKNINPQCKPNHTFLTQADLEIECFWLSGFELLTPTTV